MNYEITAKLGAGGMGEVYRARDIKLGREVAIKVLPEALSHNETIARFRRESQVLASLNHPNIAAIYGFEETEEARFLVLEIVEGETLADRLRLGPLATDETLTIARQIAAALEASHSKGVIHRDLKPTNIKVTPAGDAKVLDFGLAKVLSEDAATDSTSASLADSPTVSVGSASPGMDVTSEGVILGTAPYMSPEQVRGTPVDSRTDIWSFGCVLYECLTGKMLFGGGSFADVVGAVLNREIDWSTLPKETPEAVRTLLRRSLARDPKKRLHHIADARIELEEALDPQVDAADGPRTRGARMPLLISAVAIAVAVLSVGVTAWLMWPSNTPAPRPARQFSLQLRGTDPSSSMGALSATLALSPDGEKLVYMATADGKPTLFLTDLRRSETRELLSSEVTDTFFSPDGQWIGFVAGGKLKTLRLDGGQPETLCEAPTPFGGTWAADGTIYFAPSLTSGIWRIPASGGKPEPVTQPRAEDGEFGHWHPEILPGEGALLFTIWHKTLRDAQVAVLSFKSGKTKILCGRASQPRYSPTGHVVYARSGTLMAAPFDVHSLEVSEPHFPVVDDLWHSFADGSAPYSFSHDGLLLYIRGNEWRARRRIVWVNMEGDVTPLPLPAAAYGGLELSPDGTRLAFHRFDDGETKVWIHDLASGATTQYPSERSDLNPVWITVDHVAFSSFSGGPFDVYVVPSDLSAPAHRVIQGQEDQRPLCASLDGEHLLFTQSDPVTGLDVWLLSSEDSTVISGEAPTRREPLLKGKHLESQATFAPDGKWIAFTSDRTGRLQVFVQPFGSPGGPKQVSGDGGFSPRWAHDGSKLFYRSWNQLMGVTLEIKSDSVQIGRPEVLFSTRGMLSAMDRSSFTYDVARDGRFLFIQDESPPRLIAAVNWFDELQRRASNAEARRGNFDQAEPGR